MAVSLLQLLCDVPLAFVDTETTGASPEYGHRVTELGIVRIEGGVRVAEYGQLVNPQRRISPGVTALTGITQAMVENQPTFREQLPQAMELLSGAVIVGHHIRFDLSFLAMEFRRSGLLIEQSLSGAQVMDTVKIARRRFGRGSRNGLQRLAPRLGIEPTVAHRALADAQTTHLVFEKLIEPLAGWRTPLVDAIMAQGGPMSLLPKGSRQQLLPLELEEALEQRKPVMMEYVDADENRTQRMINPIHLKRSQGELILVAHCHLRGDRRTFKVDRIVQVTRIEQETETTGSLFGG